MRAKGGKRIQPDGTLMDVYRLHHGHWEAKDSSDDFNKEIRAKSKGYPTDNILFWEPRRAVLYQHGSSSLDLPLDGPALLCVLEQFLEFAPEAIAQWESAVEEFKDKVPELGKALAAILKKARKENPAIIAAFADFVTRLPRFAQSEPLGSRRGGNARPAPPHRAHPAQDLRHRELPRAQRHRRRYREGHRHPHRESFQPRRFPQGARPLLPRHRGGRAGTLPGIHGKAEVPQHRLRAVLPGLRGQAGGRARRRLHPAAARAIHDRQRRAGARRAVRHDLARERRPHPRPFTGTGNFIVNIMQPQHISGSR